MELDRLELTVESSAEIATKGLEALKNALQAVKGSAAGGAGLASVKVALDKIGNIKKVEASLREVNNAVKTSRTDFSGLSNDIRAVSQVYGQLPPNVQKTASAMARAKKEMDSLSANKVAMSVEEASAALKQLSTAADGTTGFFGKTKVDAEAVGAVYAALPSEIQRVIKANAALVTSNKTVSKSHGILGIGISAYTAKLGVVTLATKRVAKVVSDWITKSNDYVENLNLFTVAMGEYAESAQAYAEKVNRLMGIDSSDWMRHQGVFMTLATGFGIAADKAAVMSQNLTQLSYDLSSFYNISVNDATQKIESAFSGELEPVRRLGFDLSQTRLEAIAMSYGIDKTVSSMTQAEKSQLRYIALMTQVTQVQGDMARTLDAPANQLRVFQASVTQVTRALGNIFIPALNAILPVATAVLGVVRELAESLAAVFGFKLATVDYGSVESSSGAISDSLDDVADSAGGASDALNNYALSIDELNTISPDTGGGGGGGSSGFEDVLSDMEMPTYNFLKDLEDKATSLKDTLKEVLETLLLIGGAVALFNLATALSQAEGIANLFSKMALSTIVVALEFTIVANSIKDYITEKDIWDLIQSAIAVGASSAILYKVWGPTGAAIGFAVGVVATITGIGMAITEGQDFRSLETKISQLLAGVFGGLTGLSIAKKLGADMGEGALIGLSVATALAINVTNATAIASGQLKIDSAESIINMLLSSAFAGIAGATIIGGPTGFVIGLGVDLAVNIASALLADQSRKNAEEIAKRFGDIELSIEDMETAAVRFVGVGLNETMEEFTASKDKVAALRDEVVKLFDKLDEKTELGIEVISQEEFNTLVDTVEGYAAERKIMLQLAVDTLGLGEEMEELLTGSGSTVSKLSELGVQLKQVVSEGFNKEGEWIPEKYEKAMEIYGEMQEITNMVSQIEFEVEMEMAVDEFKLKDLTPESVKGFLETATKIIEKRVGDLKEAEVAARIELETQLEMGEIDETEYEARLEELKSFFREQKYTMYTNMHLEVDEFILETHGDLLTKMENAMNSAEMQQGLKTASQAFYNNYNKYFTGSEAEGWARIGVENVVNYSKSALVDAMSSGLSEEEKASVKTLFDSIKPDYEDTMKLAKEYYNTGLIIPEELSEGLNNKAAIAALAGDVDGILYTLGANITSSPSMMELLTKVEGAGAELPNSLVLGINNNMHLIDEAIQAGLIPVTQIMIDNFEAAGLEVPESWKEKVIEGIDNNQDALNTTGESLANVTSTAITNALNEVDYVAGVPGAIEISAANNSDALASSGGFVADYVTASAQSFLSEEDYSGSIIESVNSSVSNASSGLASAGATAGNQFAKAMNERVQSALAAANTIASSVGNLLGRQAEKITELPGYATGGFPTTGQLFIAQEAGPEMVGTIGGRTAVANNDQIVQAVSSGVYEAVMAANGNGESGNIQIVVYLDGKQIEASVRSTQQQRGAVIATGGIVNYV